jgi:hypothetical protein
MKSHRLRVFSVLLLCRSLFCRLNVNVTAAPGLRLFSASNAVATLHLSQVSSFTALTLRNQCPTCPSAGAAASGSLVEIKSDSTALIVLPSAVPFDFTTQVVSSAQFNIFACLYTPLTAPPSNVQVIPPPGCVFPTIDTCAVQPCSAPGTASCSNLQSPPRRVCVCHPGYLLSVALCGCVTAVLILVRPLFSRCCVQVHRCGLSDRH